MSDHPELLEQTTSLEMLEHPVLACCEFCGARSVKWKFDDWLACETCGDLVISADWHSLEARAQDNMICSLFYADKDVFSKPKI